MLPRAMSPSHCQKKLRQRSRLMSRPMKRQLMNKILPSMLKLIQFSSKFNRPQLTSKELSAEILTRKRRVSKIWTRLLALSCSLMTISPSTWTPKPLMTQILFKLRLKFGRPQLISPRFQVTCQQTLNSRSMLNLKLNPSLNSI